MDEFEYDEDGFSVSRKVVPIDFAVIGLGLVRDLFGTFERHVGVTQAIVASHANWLAERRLFEQEAGYEIEALTSGDEEDG